MMGSLINVLLYALIPAAAIDLHPKKRTTELSMIPEVEPRKDSANETRSSFL